MKAHHFVIIFLVFFFVMYLSTKLYIEQSTSVAKDITNKEVIFDKAIDAATEAMISYSGGVMSVDKDKAVDAFHASLYASLGITDIPDKRAELDLYLPVICITADDGFYISYNQTTVDSQGHQNNIRTWTDKIQYGYDDGYFIYRFSTSGVTTVLDYHKYIDATAAIYKVDLTDNTSKQEFVQYATVVSALSGHLNDCLFTNEVLFQDVRTETIAQTLEKYLNYYCNENNDVAQRAGIMYQFAMPAMDSATYLRAAANSSFLAIFQGYPVAGSQKTYNEFSVSNAQIVENELLMIDDHDLYHRNGCTHIGTIVSSEYSKKACAEQGAYACPYCFPNTGAHKP